MTNEFGPYYKVINSFRAKSEIKYYFTGQAAGPSVQSANLLYPLWNTFSQSTFSFKPATTYRIAHTTVSDLLMPGLCREVGFKLYEMHKDIRNLHQGSAIKIRSGA
jgi:hypothetical protein